MNWSGRQPSSRLRFSIAVAVAVTGLAIAVPAAIAKSPQRPFASASCPVWLDGVRQQTPEQLAQVDVVTAHDGQVGWDALQPRDHATYNLEVSDDSGHVGLAVFTIGSVQPGAAQLTWERQHHFHNGSTMWNEGALTCWH
jgi:hypothetical protein